MIDRRTMLKGAGAAITLPLLTAMRPPRDPAPLRAVWIMFPNGVVGSNWTPAKTGADFELPATLESLKNVRGDILFLSGLAHEKANANGDGPGDHARAAGTFLTGCQARKTDGKDIKLGISVDQVAANKTGSKTYLPSLELGCDRSIHAGNCDSGYSCAYSSNIAWSGPSTPQTKENKPRALFERLFGSPDDAASKRELKKRLLYRRSILDFVRGDADALAGRLDAGDRRKLDEYLESVRSIEKRIEAAENETTERPQPDIDLPKGVPREYQDHIRLMMDLLVLALQTDSTRIATLMLANEGSDRSFPQVGVREGHHTLSHHGRRKESMDKIQKIDAFYVSQFAYLVEKLKAAKEGDGTLLDHSMVLYGCAIGDGDWHNHDELPILLAGRAGGALSPGRHVRYKRGTPLCNLFLSMLDRLGVEEVRHGDSTGRVDQLT